MPTLKAEIERADSPLAKQISMDMPARQASAAPAVELAKVQPADHQTIAKEAIDTKAALRMLPPLIKGYLRVGAFVGDGAVVDHQFGTTDVLIVMPVSAISGRYLDHFGADATRHAA